MVLVRSVRVLPKALYNRRQSLLREVRSLIETDDKIFAGDGSFPLTFPVHFPRDVPGDPLLSLLYSIPSLSGWLDQETSYLGPGV